MKIWMICFLCTSLVAGIDEYIDKQLSEKDYAASVGLLSPSNDITFENGKGSSYFTFSPNGPSRTLLELKWNYLTLAYTFIGRHKNPERGKSNQTEFDLSFDLDRVHLFLHYQKYESFYLTNKNNGGTPIVFPNMNTEHLIFLGEYFYVFELAAFRDRKERFNSIRYGHAVGTGLILDKFSVKDLPENSSLLLEDKERVAFSGAEIRTIGVTQSYEAAVKYLRFLASLKIGIALNLLDQEFSKKDPSSLPGKTNESSFDLGSFLDFNLRYSYSRSDFLIFAKLKTINAKYNSDTILKNDSRITGLKYTYHF